MAVADRTVGAKYQNALIEKLREDYLRYLRFYTQMFVQDGYVVGTEPPRTHEEEHQMLMPMAEQIRMKAMQGMPVTPQEQRVLMRHMELMRNGQRETTA